MKMLLVLIMFFTKPYDKVSAPGLSELRRLFSLAAIKQDAAKKLSELLAEVGTSSQPVYVCYKGVAKMIQAKYALNPINKLSLFNKGKALIERAIKTDTTNVEMRFLRLTIQNNLPVILGYKNNIVLDKTYLENKINNENDNELKHIISRYLSSLK